MKIKGMVTDINQLPCEFITVTLLKNDSISVASTFTDSIGHYMLMLDSPDQGMNYLLRFSNWEQIIHEQKVQCSSEEQFFNVQLDEMNSIMLNEIVVKGTDKGFTFKNDRFAYNPPAAIRVGNSVFEVIKQTPMIKATDESISLLFQPGSAIYLNGRPLRMPTESLIAMLKATPGTDIKTIEVITNPGSQYESGLKGGIINIVLKKIPDEGLLGQLDLTDKQAYYNKQSGSLNLQYRKNKLALNTTLSGWNEPSKEFNDNKVDLNTGLIQDLNIEDSYLKRGLSLNFNVEYQLKPQHIISLLADLSQQKPDFTNVTYTRFSDNFSSTRDSVMKSTSDDSGDKIKNYFASVNYRYDINPATGRNLNISADYLNYLNQKNLYGVTSKVRNLYPESLSDSSLYYSTLPQKINSFTIKGDYFHPINDISSFSTGAFYSHSHSDNDYLFANWNGNDYVEDITKSNHFIYNENISALYITYSRNWSDKLSTTLGVRVEHTYTKGSQESSSIPSSTNDYTNIFPSLFIGYVPNNSLRFSYSLTSRIERPEFWELNPFRYYENENLYIENNPFLQSPRVLQQELAIILNNQYTFICQYKNTKNAYAQFFLPDTTQIDVTKISRLNYGNIQQYILGAIANFNLFKGFLQTNTSLIGGYIQSDMDIPEVINETTSSFFCNFRINNILNFSETKKIWGFVNFEYTTPAIGANFKTGSVSNLQVGIKKGWNNWMFSLWGDDILQGQKRKFEILGNDQAYATGKGIITPDSRSISLKITYSFGNNKLKRTRQVNAANEDLRQRFK